MEQKSMKYLKTYELFDTDDLKSEFEIPYLRGEISPEEIMKWYPVKSEIDAELGKIVSDVPWLIELNYRRSGSVLSIGFENTIKYSESDNVFYYFLIEIVRFRNEYAVNAYAKCHGNNKQIYSESIIKKSMPYDEMIKTLRKPVFNLLIDFNNYIERMFGESNFTIKDKDTLVFNPNYN